MMLKKRNVETVPTLVIKVGDKNLRKVVGKPLGYLILFKSTIIFGQSIKQILKKCINVTTLQDNK